MGSAPVSVYYDWVRWKIRSATYISVWQHLEFFFRHTSMLLGRYKQQTIPSLVLSHARSALSPLGPEGIVCSLFVGCTCLAFLGQRWDWSARCQYTVTGSDGKFDMHLLSQCGICLFVGCLTSQQHAIVSQGRICTDNFTCCHTEIETADQTFHLTQSQYTDTGPTSPSADPITPGAWQGSHWSANV